MYVGMRHFHPTRHTSVWDHRNRNPEKLLAVPDLTLTKALEITQGAEAAKKNSRSLEGKRSRMNVVA